MLDVDVSAAPVLPARFDASDPAVLEDPYPRYAELRREGPLARGGPGTWLVTRYKEVAALLGDGRLGNAFPPAYHVASLGRGPASEFFRRIVFYRDPPVHTRLRRLMAASFTPRLVEKLRELIRDRVDVMLDAALEAGRFDVIGDLAYPLAFSSICLLIGIPSDDRDEVRPRAACLARGFSAGMTDEQRHATDESTVWLQIYIERLLLERRRCPRDDLLSRMLGAEAGEDRLTHEEIVDNCVFLFWAGFETVLSLIGTGCAALLRFPQEFARLRADPSLVGSAIEEFLRFDAPIQGTSRIIRQELEIGGRRLRPGRVLVLLLGSANHDERVFVEPGRLDVGRRPNHHLSFGGGPHRCLGNVLARIEATVVFEQLARRFTAFEPAGEPERQTATAWMRFHAKIPVEAKPATGRWQGILLDGNRVA
ncbi:MAG TPA: cytochrome P450 [Solirubrobacteraceae bacterium]|nr:cytochrome P450 [Solirubrobacteraceae bacterium]